MLQKESVPEKAGMSSLVTSRKLGGKWKWWKLRRTPSSKWFHLPTLEAKSSVENEDKAGVRTGGLEGCLGQTEGMRDFQQDQGLLGSRLIIRESSSMTVLLLLREQEVMGG
jgi:hypothetical protein